jgi:hypothetical protein
MNREYQNDFTLEEINLPYDKFNDLQMARYPILSDEARDWLNAWIRWDLACSPMNDENRRFIRMGHYLGWMHSIDRENN